MEKQLDIVINRLDRISKLLTLNVLGDKTQNVKIMSLHRCGFENNEISDILGIKPNIIRATISRELKKSKGD
ncbi:MAG: hypothetical protein V3V99_08630 [candidate division Zixibacteria bacterium]